MPLSLLKRARATRLPPAWPAAAARVGLGCPFSTRVPVENSGVRFQLGCPSALHSDARFLPRRVMGRPIGVTWRDVANWGLQPPFVCCPLSPGRRGNWVTCWRDDAVSLAIAEHRASSSLRMVKRLFCSRSNERSCSRKSSSISPRMSGTSAGRAMSRIRTETRGRRPNLTSYRCPGTGGSDMGPTGLPYPW